MWREDVRPYSVCVGRLATISQAGAMLDASERQIRRLIERGELVPARIGKRLYVTRASVLAYADRFTYGES